MKDSSVRPPATPSAWIGEIRIDCLDFEQAVERVVGLAEQKDGPHLVVTPNIAFLGEARRNPEFAATCSGAALSLADGWPVSRLSRTRGCPGQMRVPGSDLLPALCEAAAARGLTVGLFGGQPGAAAGAATELRRRWPALAVTGVGCPPLGFEHSAQATEQLLTQIQKARPDLLFLAFGTPKTELFASRNLARLGSGVVISVGAALDFIHGARKRAPRAVQRLGMEWAFRLAQEPRRLFPRYARAMVDLTRVLLSERGEPASSRAKSPSVAPCALPLPPLPTLPSVAICAPARGDESQLRPFFESIDALDYPPDRLQVMVGLDGPQPRLADAAQRVGCRVITLPRRTGSYAARNAAVEALDADVDVVLFVDTGVRFGPGWVRAHVDGLRRWHRTAGPVRFHFSDQPRAVELADAARHFDQTRYVRAGFSGAGNLGVRRSVLDHLRFDSALQSGGDVDFGLRASAAGYSLGFVADAWISHPARASRRELLAKVWRVGGGVRTLLQRGSVAASPADPSTASLRDLAEELGVGRAVRAEAEILSGLCRLLYAARVPGTIAGRVRRAFEPRRSR